MNKKKYFSDLLTLFEDVGMTGEEEVVPQENIADSGEDVNQEMTQPMEEQPEEIPEDDGMINELPETQEIPAGQSIDEVMKCQKVTKLFGLYEDLLNYCTLFLDTLGNIDVSMLDLEVFKIVKKYTLSTKELAEKINNYMIKIYSDETYEKLLYVYILFRTELTTCVKGIRDILKLNNLDAKDDISKEQN